MKKKLIFSCVLLVLIIISVLGVKMYNYNNYSGELIGIKGTNTYHRDNCQFIKKATSSQLVFFEDLDKAAETEYRPCKTCRPPDNKMEVQVFKEKQVQIVADNAVKSKQNDLEFNELRDRLKRSDDLSKLEITGTNSEFDYAGRYVVTCTVKNNDDIAHEIRAQAIFYGKDNKPISTKESFSSTIDAGNMQGFTITQYENVKSIKRFELKIIK